MTIRRLPAFRRLLPAVATLAVLGVVLAGCGGSDKVSAGAAGTDGRAAQAFPASTVVFADANIDQSSDAWKNLLALGANFPAWPKLVAKFDLAENRATHGGPTLAQVRSWLGTEVAVGVLSVPAQGAQPSALAYADVRDQASLETALKAQGDVQAEGTHGGFDLFATKNDKAVLAVSSDTALAGTTETVVDAAIDRLAGTGDRLADSADYKDTLASLPTDNLLVAYAPGSVLQSLAARAEAREQAGQSVPPAQVAQITAKLAEIRSLGFSLDATDKGLRTRWTALLNSGASDLPAPFAPDLLSRVPASSWFAASFGGIGASAQSAAEKALGSNPQAQQSVAQVEAMLGIKLADLYALFSGDQALYSGPGAPVSAGLILHPTDPAQGATTLRALTRLLAQRGIAFSDTGDGQSATIDNIPLRWRSVDDVLGIGTDATVGDTATDSIANSDKYKRVLSEDGIDSGSKTLGMAYLDVPSLINVATAFGAFNHDQAALDNLRQIGGVLLWSGRDGDTVTSDLFIEST